MLNHPTGEFLEGDFMRHTSESDVVSQDPPPESGVYTGCALALAWSGLTPAQEFVTTYLLRVGWLQSFPRQRRIPLDTFTLSVLARVPRSEMERALIDLINRGMIRAARGLYHLDRDYESWHQRWSIKEARGAAPPPGLGRNA
jgi:hypothetical protein